MTKWARFARIAGWIVLIAGLTWGWVAGVPALRLRVADAADSDAVVSGESIEVIFHPTPNWLGDDVLGMLRETCIGAVSGDPLDQGDLVAVRQALMGMGCFDEVAQVSRPTAGRIEVQASFLQPFAKIEHDALSWLIDPIGRVMPPSLQPKDGSDFIAIRHVTFEPPVAAGQTWDGQDIVAALQVIRLVQSQLWAEQIASIDVDGYLDGEPLRLVTNRGSTIIWGAQPGGEAHGEVGSAEKLRRLHYLHNGWQHIDGGQMRVDIRDPLHVTAPSDSAF